MSTPGNSTRRQPLKVQAALEFILVTLKPRNRYPQGLNDILDRIYAEPFRGRCSMPGCNADHAYCLPFSHDTDASHSWTATGYPAPRIDGMRLVSKKARAKLSVYAVELCSPKFLNERPTWWKRARREQWGAASNHEMYLTHQKIISDVLKRLRGINSKPGTDNLMGIFVNDTCNLRIIIEYDGSGQDSLPVTTLKNILKSMLLQERHFDAIRSYPTIRIGPVDVSQAIGMIEAAETYPDLVLLSATFLPGLATSILPPTPARSRAIAFKYAGTLDQDEVIHYLSMTKSVLRWCDITPSDTLDYFLFSTWTDLSYSCLDFFVDIGVLEHTVTFLAYKLSHAHSMETYQRTVASISRHSPIWVLLDHVMRSKVLNSDFTTVGMRVLEKLMRGDYGWSVDDVAARTRRFVENERVEYVGYSIHSEKRADSVMGLEVLETIEEEDDCVNGEFERLEEEDEQIEADDSECALSRTRSEVDLDEIGEESAWKERTRAMSSPQ